MTGWQERCFRSRSGVGVVLFLPTRSLWEIEIGEFGNKQIEWPAIYQG